MNALFYPLRTSCPWRYLPGAPFPQRSTVYNIFRKFQREGVAPAKAWRMLTGDAAPIKPPSGKLFTPKGVL